MSLEVLSRRSIRRSLLFAGADGVDFALESRGVVPRTEHLAEAFGEAWYATFHTSSVMFSGKNSNLHQGVEVLHERESINDRPELGLFDHIYDPLNLLNVAERHPEVVADLRLQLEQWREMTKAQKVRPDGEDADVNREELEQLRDLGYAN